MMRGQQKVAAVKLFQFFGGLERPFSLRESLDRFAMASGRSSKEMIKKLWSELASNE
jgi:hypothetical protein